jgi:hypothetical protein
MAGEPEMGVAAPRIGIAEVALVSRERRRDPGSKYTGAGEGGGQEGGLDGTMLVLLQNVLPFAGVYFRPRQGRWPNVGGAVPGRLWFAVRRAQNPGRGLPLPSPARGRAGKSRKKVDFKVRSNAELFGPGYVESS